MLLKLTIMILGVISFIPNLKAENKAVVKVDLEIQETAKTLRQMHLDLIKQMPDSRVLQKYAESELELDSNQTPNDEVQIILVKNDRR